MSKQVKRTLVDLCVLALICAGAWLLLTARPNLKTQKPVALIFGAEWCDNCPSEAELGKLVAEFPAVEFQFVDIDVDKEMVAKYHVSKIPRYFVCDSVGCKTTTSLRELREWLHAY